MQVTGVSRECEIVVLVTDASIPNLCRGVSRVRTYRGVTRRRAMSRGAIPKLRRGQEICHQSYCSFQFIDPDSGSIPVAHGTSVSGRRRLLGNADGKGVRLARMSTRSCLTYFVSSPPMAKRCESAGASGDRDFCCSGADPPRSFGGNRKSWAE